jgi:transcriptional regulator with XRE-family HTH domain
VSAPTEFGALLRERRSSASMSQWDLAAAAAIDPTYVSLIERGQRQVVSRDVVLAFAEALDLTASETDRLLYAAGHAPRTDYQELYEARFGAIDSQTKWCPRCQEALPTSRFSRNRSASSGLNAICKTCESVRLKDHRNRVALRRMGRAS